MPMLLFTLLQMATHNALAGGDIVPAKPSVNANVDSGASISDLYSDIDMRVRLATKASLTACAATQCEENHLFDARVGAIGLYLSKSAAQLYPQQEKLIQKMVFSVIDKQEPGTASNNKGQIVVLRGVQDLQLSDDALGFVIAREMAHVMAGHHKTNTSTKLIISALASVLFPAIAIVGASSAAAQASTATTLLTSAASTATSMVGGEVALAKMKPTQLSQADEIARTIMENVAWDMRHVDSVLTIDDATQGAWMLDLQASKKTLHSIIEKENADIVQLDTDHFEIKTIDVAAESQSNDGLASAYLVSEDEMRAALAAEAAEAAGN